MTIQTQMKIDPQVGNIEVPTRNTEPLVALFDPGSLAEAAAHPSEVGRREGQGAGGSHISHGVVHVICPVSRAKTVNPNARLMHPEWSHGQRSACDACWVCLEMH